MGFSLSSLDPRKINLNDVASVATLGGSDALGLTDGVVGDVVTSGYDRVTGKDTLDAQTAAQNKALTVEQASIDNQIALIKENKAESKILIDELDVFLNNNNIKVERELLSGNGEVSRILLESSLAAFNASLLGVHDYADQLIKTTKDVSEELKKGNNAVALELSDTAKTVYKTNVATIDNIRARQTKAVSSSTNTLSQGVEDSSIAKLESIDNASDISKQSSVDALGRFDTIKTEAKETYTPWIENGQWATNELKNNYEELTRSFTYDDFKKDGNYELRLDQALDTISNRASAVGVTGNTAKDLVEYSQDYAGNEYGNAYNRFNADQDDKIGFLSNLSNEGLSAANSYTNTASAADTNAARAIENEGITQSNFELNRGDVNSGRITSLADIMASKEINLGEIDVNSLNNKRVATNSRDTSLGEIESNKLSTLTDINSNRIGTIGNLNAERMASDTGLRAQLSTTQGKINSNKVAGDTQIKTDILGRDAANETNLVNMRVANQNQTSSNLINAEGAKGNSLSSYYSNIGDIKANYYQNFNNFLSTLVNTGVAAYGASSGAPKQPGSLSNLQPASDVSSALSSTYNPNNFNFNFTNP